MPATYEPIATTTLGSAVNSITFSSIPATYTDLKFVVVGTVNDATGRVAIIQFNSDTSSNYSFTRLTADGSSASSGNGSATYIAAGNWYTFQSSPPSMFDMDLFSYAGSTFKTTLHSVTNDKNGSGYVEKQVSLWRSTAAINTILISVQAKLFDVGTTATLYGIKNA
jgi:hypothetical protein